MRKSFVTLSLTILTMAVVAGNGASAYAKVLETFTDACSGDVVVKVPYADAPLLDSQDIVLARSGSMCRLVESTPPTFSGVCQHNHQQNTDWTATIPYSSIQNGDRRFRWFCGETAERARCKTGTKRVRFRLGPGRDFQTECLD